MKTHTRSIVKKLARQEGCRSLVIRMWNGARKRYLADNNRFINFKRDLITLFPTIHANCKATKLRLIDGYQNVAIPHRLMPVDPQRIKRFLVNELTDGDYDEQPVYWFYHEKAGTIMGGDWDKHTRPVEIYWKYQDLFRRFVYGESWTETEHYRSLAREGCLHEEIMLALSRYDRLFAEIKRGYKTSDVLSGAGFLEEVCVCIARDGQILFSNSGWHRLVIAKLVGLDSFPVRVMIRHEIWQQIRERFGEGIKKTGAIPDELEPYREHPDLRDLVDLSGLQGARASQHKWAGTQSI